MSELYGRDDLSRDAYNVFIQRVQSEADSFGLQTRVVSETEDRGKRRARLNGRFQVFWDRWQNLAVEWDAMTPEVHRSIDPELWENIKCQAAASIVTS